MHLEQHNCMEVKNTRGGTKNIQGTAASLNHKGPFIDFIQTSHAVPWGYLGIKTKYQSSVMLRYIQMQNLHETVLRYYKGAIPC